MAPRMKFNPRTGRFESTTPPVSPTTTLPTRQYAPNDTRTDTRPKAPTATSTTVPKKKGTTTATVPKKTGTTPTTQPKYTNMAPTPVARNNQQVTSGARGSYIPPNPADYNIPPPISEKDTSLDGGIPAWLQEYLTGQGGGGQTAAQKAAALALDNANSYRAGMGAADIQQQAGLTGQQQYGTLADTSYGSAMKNIADLYNPQIASTGEFYNQQVQGAKDYYTGQGTAAGQTIDAATANLLANLKGSTAYTDVVGTNVAAPTQSLSEALKAYGGTGQAAAEQQKMDAAQGQAIADLFTRSNKQLSAADADYYNALRNAAIGAQGAARQNLATNLAVLQGQDIAGINANRRAELSGLTTGRTTAEQGAQDLRTQLLTKGIESQMGGAQTAAATRAQTTASYGVPKKAKPKAKPKSKKK